MAIRSKRPASVAPRSKRPNILQKWGRYLGEVRMELRKTTFPTRPELIAQTQVVIGLVVMVGVFIWVMDMGLAQLARFVGLAPK